jgi:hypothetical protein
VTSGWVKQPSPCCAAAAVAGAWNALGCMDRSHPSALHFPDVIAIYCTILREQIERLSQSFERKLGAGPQTFQTLSNAVANELAKMAEEALAGQPPPKKEKKVGRVAVGKAMKAAIKHYKASLPPPSPSRQQDSEAAAPDVDLAVMENMHPLLCMEEIISLEIVEAKNKPDSDVRNEYHFYTFYFD